MYLFNIKSKMTMIVLLDIGIVLLGYIGIKTINFEKIFFSHFASIITIISQYIIPLILLLGYLINKKKLKNENRATNRIRAVDNEKIENHI